MEKKSEISGDITVIYNILKNIKVKSKGAKILPALREKNPSETGRSKTFFEFYSFKYFQRLLSFIIYKMNGASYLIPKVSQE